MNLSEPLLEQCFYLDNCNFYDKEYSKIMIGEGYTKGRTARDYLIKNFNPSGWTAQHLTKKLKNLSDEMVGENRYEELLDGFSYVWMHKYVTGKIKNMEAELIKSGLTREKAKEVKRAMEPLINTCYTNEQIIYQIINYLNGQNAPIRKPDVAFPYNEGTAYQFYKHPQKDIPCINLNFNSDIQFIQDFRDILNEIGKKYPNKELYFHTTNWGAVDKILINGLNYTYGLHCLDFGQKPGFYTSHNPYHSLEWGQKNKWRWNNEIGIIVFALPYKFPKNIKYTELVNDEWTRICTYSRICDEANIDLVREVDEYDFVYGEMVANIGELNKLKEAKKVRSYIAKPHKNPKFQLVSKSYTADKFLRERIVACCYFTKHSIN